MIIADKGLIGVDYQNELRQFTGINVQTAIRSNIKENEFENNKGFCMNKNDLVLRTYICILIASLGGVISYFWIDRPLVLWLYSYNVQAIPFMQFLQKHVAEFPSKIAEWWIAPGFLYIGLRFAFGELKSWEYKLLAFLIILLIAFSAFSNNNLRSWFGRAWPQTWIHNNPSFINDGVYGFHIGLCSHLFLSFPSGHAVVATVIATFFWYYVPKLKWIALVFALFDCTMMVVQYMHFLSDVIVGAAIGYLVTIYVYAYHCSQTVIAHSNPENKY